MKITETMQGSICRICLDGRFDANTCGKVEQHIRATVNKGVHRIVLDMEKTPFVASAGLRIILVFVKELRHKFNGDLYIAALQPGVKKVFEISGLNTVLRIFDSADEAVKDFS